MAWRIAPPGTSSPRRIVPPRLESMEPPCAPELPVPRRSSFCWDHIIVAVPPEVQRGIGWPWARVGPPALRNAGEEVGVRPPGLPEPAPGTTEVVGIGAEQRTPPLALAPVPPPHA